MATRREAHDLTPARAVARCGGGRGQGGAVSLLGVYLKPHPEKSSRLKQRAQAPFLKTT